MPITTSAKKALRSSARKRQFNLARKGEVNLVIKKFKKLLVEKKTKEAEAMIPQIQKALDKGSKRGIMKPNTAARKKSRLVKMIKKTS